MPPLPQLPQRQQWLQWQSKHLNDIKLKYADQKTNADFMQRLQQNYHHFVTYYEDWDTQEQARALIPVHMLRERAGHVPQQVNEKDGGLRQDQSRAKFHDGNFQDEAVLRELLHWFKRDFFKWINEPPCPTCGPEAPKPQHVGMTQPTAQEQHDGAGRVELYQCPLCRQNVRFARYNDPRVLLRPENRRGRCGEWANCFTLMCRAMGFQCRHVHDWTDHVWTEVWSEAQSRWVHTDCCEDVWDQPLLYDRGWGKKLTYVMAVNQSQIVDVTPRYVQDYAQALPRRTICSERELQATISAIREQIRRGMPEWQVQQMVKSAFTEQLELSFGLQSVQDTATLQGRQSGSLEWRLARGETQK